MSSYSYSGYSYCVAPQCKNNAKINPKVSYFRFPKDPKRCSDWIAQAGLENKLKQLTPEQCHTRHKLCSVHFAKSMFAGLLKSRLKKNATPTLFVNSEVDLSKTIDVVNECDDNATEFSSSSSSLGAQTSDSVYLDCGNIIHPFARNRPLKIKIVIAQQV